MQQNGVIREPGGAHGWRLSVVSASHTRKQYSGTGFKTRIEAAYDYVKAVLKYDPKAAIVLQGKEIDEQLQLLGVKL